MIEIKLPKVLTDIATRGTMQWPLYVRRNMTTLGGRLRYTMRQQLKPHEYQGKLAASVTATYSDGQSLLRVGPTLKRGIYDAGLLLEKGTRPIPGAPWKPIKRWAEFRGLPAFPIWFKIRTRGIDPHPFVNETLRRGDSQVALRATARRLGYDLIAYSIMGTEGGEALSSEPLVYEG